MCGFFGAILIEGSPQHPEKFINATQSLIHRGPDEGGWWSDGPYFLGHRRLSIIAPDNGIQPMATRDGRYVITFNGEIYNYLELQNELARESYDFQTSTDTEIILAGYSKHGPKFITQLEGMFAFAIIDRKESTVFLARDRFGEKPLYISNGRSGLYFASEMQALLSLPEIDHTLNYAALSEYLCLNYVANHHSLLNSIERLPPGTYRLYRRHDLIEEQQYWQWLKPGQAQESTAAPQNVDRAAEQLSNILDGCVKRGMRSDVPVALFLSGGLDSATVAAKAVEHGVIEKAYCLDFRETGHSEFLRAKLVADKLDLPLERIELTVEDIGTFLEETEPLGDPMADSSGVAVSCLSRQVSKSFKVALSGDGGDELFGGYLTYSASGYHREIIAKLPMAVRHLLSRIAGHMPLGSGKIPTGYKAWRFLRAANLPTVVAHLTWNGAWLPSDALKLVDGSDLKVALENVLHQLTQQIQTPSLSNLQAFDAAHYLPNDILFKVDHMTMKHGLENRAPLLMPEVAAYAAALPPNLRSGGFSPSKPILRQLTRPIFGDEIADAKKEGFSIPIHSWLAGPGKTYLQDTLSPENLAKFPFLNAQAINTACSQHISGRIQIGFELWGLLVLVRWLGNLKNPARIKPPINSPLSKLDLPKWPT